MKMKEGEGERVSAARWNGRGGGGQTHEHVGMDVSFVDRESEKHRREGGRFLLEFGMAIVLQEG